MIAPTMIARRIMPFSKKILKHFLLKLELLPKPCTKIKDKRRLEINQFKTTSLHKYFICYCN